MPRLSSHWSQDRKPKTSRPAKKRQGFDALAVAEKENSENPRIRRSRLGELDDDGDAPKTSEDYSRASKRRKVETAALESENESGSDSEGHHWRLGKVNEDDDSDIDSDEAMNESDDERFAEYTFRGSSKMGKPRNKAKEKKLRQLPIVRPTEDINLSENEELEAYPDYNQNGNDDSDDLGEEAVDLAIALDMNMEEERQEAARRKPARKLEKSGRDPDQSDSASSLYSDEDDASSNASDLSFSDDESQKQSNSARLRDFIGALEEEESHQKAAGRRSVQLKHVHDEPSKLGPKSSKKLTAADLLPSVTNPVLRQSLKILQNNSKDEGTVHREGIPGKLAPPLAKRQQDRLDRTAAYEKSKETLNRWIDTVKQNRRAEHVSFPLADANAAALLNTKQLLPTSSSKPVTSLEEAIQDIVHQSGLSSIKDEEARLQASEQLQAKKISMEEVQARRAELRKQRDLMFREEKRAKRIKKIKSKAYRRVHRKARDREAQVERQELADAGLLDIDDERERNERRRAEERMGARHRESKWAKGMKASGRTVWDEEARSGVADLARRDEELRQRIQGRTVQDEDATSPSASSDSADDLSDTSSSEAETQRLNKKLNAMDKADDADDPPKLASMKFMQRAEASRRAANDAAARELRNDIAGMAEFDKEPDSDDSAEIGRQTFGQQKEVSRPERTHQLHTSELEAPQSDSESDSTAHGAIQNTPATLENGNPKNGNRKRNSASAGSSIKKTVSDGSRTSDGKKVNPFLLPKSKDREEMVSHDHRLPMSVPEVDEIVQKSALQAKKSSPEKHHTQDLEKSLGNGFSDSESDTDHSAATPRRDRREELIKAAFAGEEVSQDFSKEKQATIKEEGDQVVDETLPGWGSWAGEGLSKRDRRPDRGRFVRIHKGVDQEKRQDAKLDRVIINEKRVKKVSLSLLTIAAKAMLTSTIRTPANGPYVFLLDQNGRQRTHSRTPPSHES
ncbi:MAG: hypothetical protein Q9227_002556 [Pyrenula ochraceoflavens]